MRINYYLLFFIALGHTSKVFSQEFSKYPPLSSNKIIEKRPVDTSVFGKWPYLSNPSICNNGKYVVYTINNVLNRNSLIVQSIYNSWKREFIDGTNANFSTNSKLLVFKSNDSIWVLAMADSSLKYIGSGVNYKLINIKKDDWITFMVKGAVNTLVLYNLSTYKEQTISGVKDYLFSNNGNYVLLQLEVKENNNVKQVIKLIDWVQNKSNVIWEGKKVSHLCFDNSGNQIAFLSEDDMTNGISLWYYSKNMAKASMRIDGNTLGLDNKLKLAKRNLSFSQDGKRIFLKLQRVQKLTESKLITPPVDIWTYKDVKLQSQQLDELNRPFLYNSSYDAVLNIEQDKVIRLIDDNEEIIGAVNGHGDFALVCKGNGGNMYESQWNPLSQSAMYLVSKKSGEKKLLKSHLKENQPFFKMSPYGKYVISYDTNLKNYFCYETATAITFNLTKDISVSWIDKDFDLPGSASPNGLAGWLEGDSAVFIYDSNFDIWQLNIGKDITAVNITNGYAFKHKIKFRFSDHMHAMKGLLKRKSSILLSAFNHGNKENGFFRIKLGSGSNPEKLTMGPYLFHWPSITSFPPLKAKEKDIYLVQRMDYCEAPNYLITRDFKKFTRLSELMPHANYNWITAELVQWKSLDSSVLQGILYKPENFDSKKKYPVIFHFYEKLSNYLHYYWNPASSTGPINIPWFTSKGYIVFVPDIHYKIGEPGESAYNSVVSAVYFLSQMSFINPLKMGIQGHSFGGYEVNYLLTHSNLFSAAVSASGPCNLISLYNSLFNNHSMNFWFESGQGRFEHTLWQKTELYVKNSPILLVDKVATPVLIMHNKNDLQVPWSQGIEWFTALRRLGKKVWMLQYDDEGHEVSGKSAEDYTFRITQFFDFFLKDSLPPKWIVEGIPAKCKGKITGYELERTN